MEYLGKIWEFIGHLSLIQWIYGILVFLLGGGLYFWRYIKSQFRFGKNLKRKIYFLKTSNEKDLQNEKDLLNKLNLFNIESDIKDISGNLIKLQNLNSNAIYIVGYDKNYTKYKEIIDDAKQRDIPVIIFAKQGEIKDHWGIFNGYIYCDVANTSNRLAIIILNILKIV